MKIEPRSPRVGEYFRVKPHDCVHKTILLDVPEKGVVSKLGYHLVADDFAPQAWADPKVSPYLRHAVIYACQNQDGEHFFWAVDEEDADSLALAHAAEMEWVARDPLQ